MQTDVIWCRLAGKLSSFDCPILVSYCCSKDITRPPVTFYGLVRIFAALKIGRKLFLVEGGFADQK